MRAGTAASAVAANQALHRLHSWAPNRAHPPSCACASLHLAAWCADYAGAAPYSEKLLAEVLQELRCVC